MNIIWLIPVIAGLLIELFFRLIRYSDDASKQGPVAKYRQYNNYVTVNEFIAGGKKRWWKYILFRSLPPLIIFILLVSIYQKHFPTLNFLYPLILAALVSLLPRDIYQLFKSDIAISEKIVHFINIFFVAIIVGVVVVITKIASLAIFAPSASGIVDNMWSSLFVATLIIFYLDATNQADTYKIDSEKENLQQNYIISSYNKIHAKFNDQIIEYCKKHNSSVILLYAILIYEDINRPVFIRVLENILVRTFHCELTVGIAQVKSKIPLTDNQSIEIASRILENSEVSIRKLFNAYPLNYSDVKKFLKNYNSNKTYSDSVIKIMGTLRRFIFDSM